MNRITTPASSVIKKCIEQQFSEIKRILADDADSFIGYAPVLDALSLAYDDERNTLTLLQKIQQGESSYSLMRDILLHLLEREHDKFTKAFCTRLNKSKDDLPLKDLYLDTEQLNRLLYYVVLQDYTLETISDKLNLEYHEKYLSVVDVQLPQHPFLKAVVEGKNAICDFAGIVFKDYVIAYGLSEDFTASCVDAYLSEYRKYCPSQMLIEFYAALSGGRIKGKYLSLMYSSFKASTRVGDRVVMYISGTESDCFAEFCMFHDEKLVHSITLEVEDFAEGLSINQLSDCYIDVAGKVCIGIPSEESRIANSVIQCDEIVWCSNNVLIEAYSPGNCVIDAGSMKSAVGISPRFEIKTDKADNLKVYSDSINSYYKLLAYKCEKNESFNAEDFTSFANLIRRIFSCLRCHSKDTPARKKDFIDHRIISNSEKKSVLNFLLANEILFTDEQDWLYKLNIQKLTEYKIQWNNVRDGDYKSLEDLFNDYTSSSCV